MTNNIYSDEQKLSYEMGEVQAKVTQMLISEIMFKPYYGEDFPEKEERRRKIEELSTKITEKEEAVLSHLEEYRKIRSK